MVWPWLVQLGQGRGGLYSYDGLENLAGGQIRNGSEIQLALQQLHVGDRIVLHGRSGFGPEVVPLEPGRTLVLAGPRNEKGRNRPGPSTDSTARTGRHDCSERGRGVAGNG